ncbi:DUF72 domain-containing protein [Hahella chejuensis]|nr:DUF72 domain-containing protein [Hahella chejuensis]
MKQRDDAHGVRIGASGWSYTHWRGPFYPQDLPDGEMLSYYCRHFDAVELNSSFYHLLPQRTLLQWRDATPPDFLFSVKASRYITHMKKLKDPERHAPPLLERISALEDKLGPILFQLPPHWRFNGRRLKEFLQALSRDFRYAFEFRDPIWYTQETYDLLADYRAAFCIHDLNGFLAPVKVTANLIYLRLHGPDGATRANMTKQGARPKSHAIAGRVDARLNRLAQD